MKLPRRSFFEFLASLTITPFAVAAGVPDVSVSTPDLGKMSLPAFDSPDSALLEWLSKPRIPVLETEDHQTAVFIWAMLNRKKVDFIYLGGSTPGKRRIVSPGLVFRLEEWGPVYISGFCHLRGEERVFRVDRVMPSAIVN
jgi:hypothetical protein